MNQQNVAVDASQQETVLAGMLFQIRSFRRNLKPKELNNFVKTESINSLLGVFNAQQNQ